MKVGGFNPAHYWTRAQVLALALVCLLVGIALGYLFRSNLGTLGFGRNAAVETVAPSPTTASPPTPEQLAATARTQAAALLEQLTTAPNDAALLARIGNIYYDNQQFREAVEYYRRSLQVKDDVNVRADLGTSFWYQGDADSALAEYQRVLAIDPKHAGTLFNLGIVRWQGKKDAEGALQAWDMLLRSNPDFRDKEKVLSLIQQAKSTPARAQRN